MGILDLVWAIIIAKAILLVGLVAIIGLVIGIVAVPCSIVEHIKDKQMEKKEKKAGF